MKIIKLFLVVLTLTAICIAVNMNYNDEGYGVTKPPPLKPDYSLGHIINQIDSLKNLPASSFQRKFYNKIIYEIDIEIDDSETNKSLQQMAHIAYTHNFIRNSKNVFGGQTWNNNDVGFIRTEVEELMISSFFETTAPQNKELLEIKNCINDYDKIKRFISLRGFTSNSSGETLLKIGPKFPFLKLKSKISKVEVFRSLINNSAYLKNNIQLSNGLKRIKRDGITLYENYVEEKIINHRESYKVWGSGNTYTNFRLYVSKPLEEVLTTFKKNCIDNGYDYDNERIKNVKKILVEIDADAYEYFSNKSNN